MSKIKVGIIGAAGYTAGELLRILIHHPGVEIAYLQSESNANNPIDSVHTDLFFASNLKFCTAVEKEADVVFLCKGHGESVQVLKSGMIGKNIKIIDLSQDFRLSGIHLDVQDVYGSFVYGLPELNKSEIKSAKNVANPGCFATCMQLGLIPLANSQLLSTDIHISAITGSTGAGQKLTSTSHFSWRNNNMSVYKPFKHQHLNEIRQSIKQLDPNFDKELLFIPYRGNFTRGIIATMYLNIDVSLENIQQLYDEYYHSDPFVKMSTSNIDLKQVVNTNYGLIYLQRIEDRLMIISAIDNLIKGASGQAVQNMNLMFGLDESTGLNLKGTAF
jgi:N-acetyl-gamma-glutamyl-phosphate reductase